VTHDIVSSQADAETDEIREAHRFSIAALESYMGAHVPDFGGSLAVRQFKGGQSNPTFLLESGGRRYVMRKKPPGKLLPSAHQVEREYRILRALSSTDVPVPKVHFLCEDADVIGTPFYVMDHVEGRIFRNPRIPNASGPAERGAIIDTMNETLAKLHRVDYEAAGLGDFGKAGNYMARQVSRWSNQYDASKTDDIKTMDRLMEWLPKHVPDDDSSSIAHGDFRLENMIVHPAEPRVLAVLDWELSTIGHPLADLGYNCMVYHLPAGDFAGSGYLGADLAELGIPSEPEYVQTYCERVGRSSAPQFSFYVAFGLFRLAAIVQGVYKRGLDGNASSASALKYGPMVHFLAGVAWQLLEEPS
jgi:aminoglycoside phosphotransferase (APT) family kinase protein